MASFGWRKVEWISHFQQPPGRHPTPRPIPLYRERVELMTAGRGWIEDQGGWREVVPGDLIWSRPGHCTIGRSDFRNPYQCLSVTLLGTKRGGAGLPRFSRWPDLDDVRAFTREALQLFLDEEFSRRALLEHVAAQLVLRVRLHAREQDRRDLPHPLRAVLERLERDCTGPCRMEDLAACAGWSAAHLHEIFRRHLQTTPHQMLLRLRLRRAKERLASTNEPVKRIAVECGFSDAAAFGNAFREATGMTPGNYRDRSFQLPV